MNDLFFGANPGLSRRFPPHLQWELFDYTPDDLLQIAKKMLREINLSWDDVWTSDAREAIDNVIFKHLFKCFINQAGDIENITGALSSLLVSNNTNPMGRKFIPQAFETIITRAKSGPRWPVKNIDEIVKSWSNDTISPDPSLERIDSLEVPRSKSKRRRLLSSDSSDDVAQEPLVPHYDARAAAIESSDASPPIPRAFKIPSSRNTEPPRLRPSGPLNFQSSDPPRLRASDPPRLRASDPPRLRTSDPRTYM